MNIPGQGSVPAAHAPEQRLPKQTARTAVSGSVWPRQMLWIHAPFAPPDTHVKSEVFAELFLETSSQRRGAASARQPARGGAGDSLQHPANAEIPTLFPCVHGLKTGDKFRALWCAVPRKARIRRTRGARGNRPVLVRDQSLLPCSRPQAFKERHHQFLQYINAHQSEQVQVWRALGANDELHEENHFLTSIFRVGVWGKSPLHLH